MLFTAYSSPERVDYYAGDQLRFDAIITNVGGAYDPDTCRFVSSLLNLYLFSELTMIRYVHVNGNLYREHKDTCP